MASGAMAGGDKGSHLPAALESRAERARPLDASVRGAMERSFGTSLGEVVVHTDAEAAASAERLDAKAYAVGRHVVFGPGRYDPHSDAGRALIGHELAHVVQQRRGGARPGSNGVHPAGTAAEGAAHSAGARAAAGLSASVGGGTAPGVSRASKGEEDPEVARLKAENRASDMQNLGAVEGVLLEGAGIVDTLIGFGYSAHDVGRLGVDELASALDLSPENRSRLKSATDVLTGGPVLEAVRDRAKAAELYDPTTRSPAVSSLVTSAGDWLEKKYDETLGTTKPENDDLFTDRELYEIFGQLGAKTVLTAIDVEEVKTLLAVVNVLGAVKPILDAVNKNPHGWPSDRDFWTKVVAAVLTVAGMRAGGANRKIARVLIDLALATVTLGPLVERLSQDWNRPPGADRDAALKQDAKDLAKAILNLLHQILLQAAMSRSAKARGERSPAGGAPKAGRQGATSVKQPQPSGEPRTPLGSPAPPSTAPVAAPPTPAAPAAAAPKAGGTKPSVRKAPGRKSPAKRTTHTSTAVTPVPAAGTPETAGVPGAPTSGTAKTEPVRIEPVKTGPVKTGPVKTGPVKTGPVKTGPVKTGPVRIGPVKTSPVEKPSGSEAGADKTSAGTTTAPPAKSVPAPVEGGEARPGSQTAASTPTKTTVPKAGATATRKTSDRKPAAAAAGREKVAAKTVARETAAATRKDVAAKKAAARAEAAATKAAAKGAAAAARKEAAAAKAAAKEAAAAARKEAAARKAAERAEAAAAKAAAKEAAAAARKAAAAAKTGSAETTEQAHRRRLREVRPRAAELRAEIRRDKNGPGLDRLEALYKTQPDRVLAALEKSDPVAGQVLTQRYKQGLEADVKRHAEDDFRPPHEASVRVVDKDGYPVHHETVHSGGVTKERRQEVGMNQANQESHTEAKASREIPLKPGQTMRITGQYNPCDPCLAAMQAGADRSGGRINYWWPGGPKEGITFEPTSRRGKKP
ncbi:eCIS core domain-containing protein [Embleya scabrispora]|uniref:eCIS core domain-containing protein n=1 Tax=Embleya scabrispora TaxID=159449 RepID=UPI00099EA199|nr:DUF4157 domain-containing protein [Embleya scabrispora]MYS85058.1 DUF4157 domain-containing protein [Streptomyces sp. SID5474]